MRSITSFETQSVSGGNSLVPDNQCTVGAAPFDAISNMPKNALDTIVKTLGAALPYAVLSAAKRDTPLYSFGLVPVVQFVLCTASDILYEQYTR